MFKCIYCQSESLQKLLDFGEKPLVNNLLNSPNETAKTYPLNVFRCRECNHFSTGFAIDQKEIFNQSYPYRTSINSSYLFQCKNWAERLRGKFHKDTKILEIGCNDGYLLKILQDCKYKNVLGIDPCFISNHPIIIQGFFNKNLAEKILSEDFQQDIIIANNVIGHVPDLKNFLEGVEIALKDKGSLFIEIPDFQQTCEKDQYDCIYHEHYSYFTRESLKELMKNHHLYLKAYEYIPSHGGSIRYEFTKTI